MTAYPVSFIADRFQPDEVLLGYVVLDVGMVRWHSASDSVSSALQAADHVLRVRCERLDHSLTPQEIPTIRQVLPDGGLGTQIGSPVNVETVPWLAEIYFQPNQAYMA